MTKQINENEYLQIVGLLALADRALSKLEDIEASIKSVLHATEADEEISGVGGAGHIGDAIYSRYSAETLLKKLGIVRFAEQQADSA